MAVSPLQSIILLVVMLYIERLYKMRIMSNSIINIYIEMICILPMA